MKKFLLIGGVLVVFLGALLPKPTSTPDQKPQPNTSLVKSSQTVSSVSPVAKPEKTYRFHLVGVKAVSE